MRIDVDDKWRVNASCDVHLPISASKLWGQMRDWTRFACIDPLHAHMRVIARPPRTNQEIPTTPRGTSIVIAHRFLGIGPDRIGRVLCWREGSGFVFSDLSKRGVKVGFPHVCSYEVHPLTGETCRLRVGARGLWTARWLPRWLVRLWLRWVLAETRSHIQRDMNRFHAWLIQSNRT
jgi:hypothetical protein